MEDTYKEVDFEKYCKTCKYKDRDEKLIPCCYCLEETENLYSQKPVKWEEVKK